MTWKLKKWSGVPGLVHGFCGRDNQPPEGVVTLKQVHGTNIIDSADATEDEAQGDGLVTSEAGIVVAVRTADCVPILLLARERGVAAAVHAGWRGLAAGIADQAIETLRTDYGVEADEIETALGPAIGGCCYEIGEEVQAAIHEKYGELGAAAFSHPATSLHLDLRQVLEAVLIDLGVQAVTRIGPCTSCEPSRLHSFRRDGTGDRQMSFIGFNATT